MMGLGVALTLPVLALLAFCVTAETCQQLCFKLGASRAAVDGSTPRSIALQPFIWAGVVIWVVEVIAWIFVLRHAPLSVAYPVMTLTYVGVPLGGVLLLGERMTRRQVGAAALIAGGVFMIAVAGGEA